MPEVLRGIGVSPGTVGGPVARMAPPPALPPPVPVSDRDAEAARAVAALTAVAADLDRRAVAAETAAPGGTSRAGTAAEILRAQAMMAADPVLRDAVATHVADGRDAPHAIAEALAAHREAFLAAGGYLAERAADLDDLRDRAVAVCLGAPLPGVPDPGHPYVLIARDLSPADTAGLDPADVLAIVTEEGGPTSHTAILARAAGLPAIVRCTGALGLVDGTVVGVDGGRGELTVGVDEVGLRDLRERNRIRVARLAQSRGPGRTADGHPVALLANVGSVRDLQGMAADAVEGVGLFRTELLYLDRSSAPTQAEQAAAYAAVFAECPGRRVVVRTLDAGADKPLPFLSQPPEPNPALGVRGLRLARRRPDVLDTQLAALAEAAKASTADVWVMAPMVATVAEAAAFVDRCRAAGLPTAGVMVEVPAAALRADALAGVVDFLSIGTNDLSQYAFAADRQVGELAELLDPWQPALLSLIAACGDAGRRTGTPVGVCGEAAADPELAPVLVGLGVTSLSMAPRAVAEVRLALSAHTVDDCRRAASLALDAADASEARALVRKAADRRRRDHHG
ncbi:MAG TPA: phosphoenolpyruvate--protein phosphotransferase [Micromonosporaceae bacterium]|nr:phosphoenolpyruvate--protein phosphotransferase [Micromonosporaceae bacterium]